MTGSQSHSGPDSLRREAWVEELQSQQGFYPVVTAGALLANNTLLPPDHMFTAFLKVNLIRDMLCLFSNSTQQFATIVTLGSNICGHPKICHGANPQALNHQTGLTAAVIDETLGGLIYMLKRDGSLPPGPAFTVHLEVDYNAPVPASTVVICTAQLDRLERRKIFLTARVEDKPGGMLYAKGSAIFVVPREASNKEAPPDPAATQTPVLAEQLERRSSRSAQQA
ncbi:hypothetical protein WJX74_010532 [Apatococcus lobatus]|uniref:Thioesterase domain-containing protein n=1 Tax=Apatococcus lobatus TaxID=904363 RepID=A0AAW1SHH3_9CHLO